MNFLQNLKMGRVLARLRVTLSCLVLLSRRCKTIDDHRHLTLGLSSSHQGMSKRAERDIVDPTLANNMVEAEVELGNATIWRVGGMDWSSTNS
jgi:hypothetical protein